MESKIENISNNQGLIDLFKGLIGSNLNLKNGIEGDNFSSMLEKFSHNTTKDKFSNNIKNTENSKDNITYKNQDVNQNKNETNNVNLSNSLEKQKEVKDISQNVRNTSEIKQNSKEEAQKIKPIKTDETVQTSEDELKENAEIPEELNEIIDVFDENITDVVLKLDDNLINTIISALKETNTLSTQELSNIKDKLEDFKETFSNVNFSDLLDNIKQVLQSENISNENISEFIKNISNTVSELIKENKISLSAEFVVENDDSKAINLKIDSNKENAQDDEQSNLTLTFEKILKEIFRANMVESGDTENQSNNTFDFNTMFTKNNNNSQNSQEFVNVNFQEIIKESSIENSSMMNLKNNFNTTEDFIKTINADVKNSIDINIKNETSLKSLDTVTSLRVLERVQEVLKAVSSSKDGSTISLRLDPPSLGEVKVDMSYKNGSLFARIIAESQEVENLLKSKVGELQQVLRDSGIEADNVTVFIASRDNYENSDENNNGNNSFSQNRPLKVINPESEDSTSNTSENNVINETPSDSKWIA